MASDELEELRWFTVDELTRAVQDRSVLLSAPVSIAFRLLADWYKQQGGGDLDHLTRVARGKDQEASARIDALK
jgi:hypothetical protein